MSHYESRRNFMENVTVWILIGQGKPDSVFVYIRNIPV